MDIQPDHWNTNWQNSSGLVSAKIQGGDLTTIDPTTILLYSTSGGTESTDRAIDIGGFLDSAATAHEARAVRLRTGCPAGEQ